MFQAQDRISNRPQLEIDSYIITRSAQYLPDYYENLKQYVNIFKERMSQN